MKTIKFPAEKAQEFKDMLKSLVGSAPDEGFTIDQVRTSIKVLDKIDAPDGEIVLEDAEHIFVTRRIGAAKWRLASKDILDFVDAVNNAA